MKKLIRESIISLLSATGIIYLYQRRQRRSGPRVRVICFHDVKDRAWFERVVSMMSENYHLLRVADFEQHQFADEKINLLLTFDDGYQSWVEVVLPVLKQYGLQGLFFVSSGLLDAAAEKVSADEFVRNNLKLTTTRQLLTWAGAQTLITGGQVVGGHTASHRRVNGLARQELLTEIAGDKTRLEAALGQSILHFAYPFGRREDYSFEAEAVANEAGYVYRYHAEPSWITNFEAQPLPRLLLEEGQSLKSIERWVEGGYDLFCAYFKK